MVAILGEPVSSSSEHQRRKVTTPFDSKAAREAQHYAVTDVEADFLGRERFAASPNSGPIIEQRMIRSDDIRVL